MPLRTCKQWLSTITAIRRTSRRPIFGSFSFGRRLRIEPLEDRRLLTITVNTLVDEADGSIVDGDISLRDAIAAAPASDTINFSVNGTINLTSLGQLTINKSLTISGPGANLLTIQAYDPTPAAGNGRRVFNIDDGNTSNHKTVAISGLTVTGGDVSGDGGAIRSVENLTVSNSTISGSAASGSGEGTGRGGGIFSSNNRNLTVTGSTISGNSAQYGGGIFCHRGTLTITLSTVSGNAATYGDGGGVYSYEAPTTITSSTISGNSTPGDGGGIFSEVATMTITASTVSGNSAYYGGGIYSNEGTLNVSNSTISGNEAQHNGGGIVQHLGNITVTHSTITANRADSDNNGTGLGGGVRNISSGTEAFRHTILALNTRGASTRSDASGPIELQYSLLGDNSGATVNNQGNNQIGTSGAPINPQLASLANNLGPTMTHALLSTSPAIDKGNASAVAGSGGVPLYDQRGAPYSRVIDGDATPGARIDIGAFEYEYAPPPAAMFGDYNADGVASAADYVKWRQMMGSSVAAFTGADGDGDGTVDPDDLNVWRSHFGQSVPGFGAGGGASGAAADVADTSGSGSSSTTAAAFAIPTSASNEKRAVFVAQSSSLAAAAPHDEALLAWLSQAKQLVTTDPEMGNAVLGDDDGRDSFLQSLDLGFSGLEDGSLTRAARLTALQ